MRKITVKRVLAIVLSVLALVMIGISIYKRPDSNIYLPIGLLCAAAGNFMNIWSYREMEKKQEGK